MRMAAHLGMVCGLGFASMLMAACTPDVPLPLPARAHLAASLAALKTGPLPQGGRLQGGRLTVAEVAVLALNNSPDLAAARTQRGVAQAQVLQAGILMNPSLTGAILPLLAGPAASPPLGSATNAFSLGLSYDLRALITNGARRQEAAANARSIEASLLWQEWQTIAQARLLAVDIIEGDRLLAVLRRNQDLVRARAETSRAALEAGNVTLSTAAPDIAAVQAASGAALDQERVQLGRRHLLNALLGCAPDLVLDFADTPDIPPIDPEAIRQALPTLADRRPDLAALRFGYAAANARLRAAILAQFPPLSLGVSGGSDNSNIRNIGPQITMELPIFDRNQGNIAIGQATRAQLHAEYAARLAAAQGQVGAMLAEMALLQRQLAALRPSLPPLQKNAAIARAARQAGDLDERAALDLIQAPLAREQEIVALEQSLAEQQVAIATLVGADLPPLRIAETSP